MERAVIRHDSREWQTAPNVSTTTIAHRGVPLRVSLRLIQYGYDPRRRECHFAHPAPVFSRLFLFPKGSAHVRTSAGEHVLRRGSVYLLPPGQAFDVDYHPSELNFYHVFVHGMAETSVFAGMSGVPAVTDRSLFDRVLSAFWGGNVLKLMATLSEAVSEFVAPLLDGLAQSATRMSEYEELLRLIRQTPPAILRIDDLAAKVHRSRSAISKGFHAKMGMPLKQYILKVQLQRAHELLQMTDRTVQSVARELGYEAPNYFYRFFKKMTGLTPSEYRLRLERSTRLG
jgi:AraC family transcriptional regulator of arabinose operon